MKIIDITYFVEAIHTAASMGIDSLLIEPTGIRGINEDRNIVMIQSGQLPFGTVGFNCVKYLSNRLKVFKRTDKINAEFKKKSYELSDVEKIANLAKEHGVSFDISEFTDKKDACIQLREAIFTKITAFEEEIENARSGLNNSNNKKIISINKRIDELSIIDSNLYYIDLYGLTAYFSVGNIKLTQRCNNPGDIKAPIKINDEPKYSIDIQRTHVLSLQKICRAVKTELFHLKASKEGVFLSVQDNDSSGSKFNIKIGDTDDGINFDFSYITKSFVKLINCDKCITIGEKGVLTTTLNGFEFHMLTSIEVML